MTKILKRLLVISLLGICLILSFTFAAERPSQEKGALKAVYTLMDAVVNKDVKTICEVSRDSRFDNREARETDLKQVFEDPNCLISSYSVNEKYSVLEDGRLVFLVTLNYVNNEIEELPLITEKEGNKYIVDLLENTSDYNNLIYKSDSEKLKYRIVHEGDKKEDTDTQTQGGK